MIREPFLAFEGIHNFRDYGGWPITGGGRVRTGLLWRSGQHVGASDGDLAAISLLGIRTVVDLRGTSERERNPCRRARDFDAAVLLHDGETSSSPPHMDVGDGTTEDARDRMIAIYTRMARNPAMAVMFGRYLHALAERDGPSLVHCFAGKDRTGVAAMLVLHILGVSPADQLTEYLRTNDAPTLAILAEQSLPGIAARLGRPVSQDEAQAWLGVEPAYLETFWSEVNKDHGSLDAYIADVLRVDDKVGERLRARYLA